MTGIEWGEVFADSLIRRDAVCATPRSDSEPGETREIPGDPFDIREGYTCSRGKGKLLADRPADRLLSLTAFWRGQVVSSDGLDAVEKGWPEVALVLIATRWNDRQSDLPP